MIEGLNNCKERFKLASEIDEGFPHFWIFIIPIDLSYLNKLSDLPEDETSLKEKNFIISDNIGVNSLANDCISIIYRNGLFSSDEEPLINIQNNASEHLYDEIKSKPNNSLLPLNKNNLENSPYKGFSKDKSFKENELLYNREEKGKKKKEISKFNNNLDNNYSLIDKDKGVSKSQIQNYNINIYNPYINCVNICCPPSSFSPFSSVGSNIDNNNKLIFNENSLVNEKEINKGKLPLDCFCNNSKNINVHNIVSDFSLDNRDNNNINFIINNSFNQLGANFPVNYPQNELTKNITINNNNKILNNTTNKNDNQNNIQNNNINNGAQKAKKTKKKKKKKIDDEYTIEMFGRRGWICEGCNNFNYESRKNCNRCKIPKKPLKKSILMDNKGNRIMDNFVNANHKDDWNCYNCGNVNYAFRLNCNRCQMERENSIKAYNEQ